MGPAALVAPPARPKNDAVLRDTSHVLDQLKAAATAPRDREALEWTLTDGYAQALALEAERYRLEKRLADVARSLPAGDAAQKAKELSALAARLEGNTGDLKRLRGALADLRGHADRVR